MRTRLALLALTIMLVVPATAFASPADERRHGQQLIAQLQAKTRDCGQLSAEDFGHIGEYAMFHALGSTSLHQAMNERMTATIGEQGETRMHELLGQRYTGCHSGSGATTGYGWMGPGMIGGSGTIGGYSGNGSSGAMMNSTDRSRMIGSAWQTTTRQDWQRLQQHVLRTSASTTASPDGGWHPLAIVAVTVATVLLAALAIFALIRRPFRRQPTAASST